MTSLVMHGLPDDLRSTGGSIWVCQLCAVVIRSNAKARFLFGRKVMLRWYCVHHLNDNMRQRAWQQVPRGPDSITILQLREEGALPDCSGAEAWELLLARPHFMVGEGDASGTTTQWISYQVPSLFLFLFLFFHFLFLYFFSFGVINFMCST